MSDHVKTQADEAAEDRRIEIAHMKRLIRRYPEQAADALAKLVLQKRVDKNAQRQ